MIKQTIATLRAGSTQNLYSHSVNQITRAEIMTTTDPRASASTCKKTPCMLRFLGFAFLVLVLFELACEWGEFYVNTDGRFHYAI